MTVRTSQPPIEKAASKTKQYTIRRSQDESTSSKSTWIFLISSSPQIVPLTGI